MSGLIGKMLRTVKGEQRGMRVIAARVDGTGTASILEGGDTSLSLTDTGTGDYLLTFGEPFQRVPVVIPVAATSAVEVRLGTISKTAVQILGFASADGTTATDTDFHVVIIGFDAEDEV